MKKKMIKFGNSLVVLIPSSIVNILDLKKGDEVNVELKNKKIIIEKEVK